MLNVPERTRFLEADIKALALNYLRDKNEIDENSIIINEFTVDQFSRRVDLVVYSNGRLIAFEVKSEADSLARLNGQVQKYLEYFDKVIVIADKKFTSKILEKLPANVGLWEVDSSKIKIKVRGRVQQKIENEKLIDMMDVVDLSKLSTKLKIQTEKQRNTLVESLQNAPYKSLKHGVKASLDRKYRSSSETFLKETTNRVITTEDLKLLSRFKSIRDIEKRKTEKQNNFWTNIDIHVQDLRKFVNASTTSTNQPNPHQYQACRQRNHSEAACEDAY